MVASARKLIGATNPLASEPGTIRGDFAIEVGRNIVHGSDSVENGERETGACMRACGCAGVHAGKGGDMLGQLVCCACAVQARRRCAGRPRSRRRAAT